MGILTGRARHRWAQAATLQDLADLTALWLEGRLNYHPSYGRSPDPETVPIVPVLARLNRAGFLTSDSQPGSVTHGRHGAVWKQRAAVAGFAGPQLAGLITRAAVKAGMLTRVMTAALYDPRDRIPATTWNNQPRTWFGARRDADDVALELDGCSAGAIHAVTATMQVTIVDPEWGRDDALWPLLAEASRRVANRYNRRSA